MNLSMKDSDTQKEKEAAMHRFYSTQKLFEQYSKGIINFAELEAKMIEVSLRTSAPVGSNKS